MTAPANHHLTIALPDGKHARATVTYLQPKRQLYAQQRAPLESPSSEQEEPCGGRQCHQD
jgi:hypothetical protein